MTTHSDKTEPQHPVDNDDVTHIAENKKSSDPDGSYLWTHTRVTNRLYMVWCMLFAVGCGEIWGPEQSWVKVKLAMSCFGIVFGWVGGRTPLSRRGVLLLGIWILVYFLWSMIWSRSSNYDRFWFYLELGGLVFFAVPNFVCFWAFRREQSIAPLSMTGQEPKRFTITKDGRIRQHTHGERNAVTRQSNDLETGVSTA